MREIIETKRGGKLVQIDTAREKRAANDLMHMFEREKKAMAELKKYPKPIFPESLQQRVAVHQRRADAIAAGYKAITGKELK